MGKYLSKVDGEARPTSIDIAVFIVDFEQVFINEKVYYNLRKKYSCNYLITYLNVCIMMTN